MAAPQHIGPYSLGEILGRGRLGIVYRVKDHHADPPLAIRVFANDVLADPDRLVRCQQQAKAAADLDYEGINPTIEFGSAAGVSYMTMPYCPGEPLSRRLGQEIFPLGEALDIAGQLASALQEAHEAGILHGSLNPSNVVNDPDGDSKILDFGLAHLLHPENESNPGKLRYIAPEQAGGQPATAASDIFALGAILYEMVTSQPAFPGESRQAVLAAMRDRAPRRVSALVPGLPPELDTILAASLAPNLAARTRSIEEFQQQLRGLQKRESSPSFSARLRGFPWITVAVLLAIVIGGANLLLYFERKERNAPEPYSVRPLLDLPGSSATASIAPSGTEFAFSWDGGDPSAPAQIYVNRRNQPKPVRLTSAATASLEPAWSPDGRSIAFLRQDPSSGPYAVYLISAAGGEEKRIGEAAIQGRLSWFPDSRRLCLTDLPQGARTRTAIFALALDGSRRQLTNPPRIDFSADRDPYLSSDGGRLLFTRQVGATQSNINQLDIDPAGNPAVKDRQLTSSGSEHLMAVYTPNGQGIFYIERYLDGSTAVLQANLRGFPEKNLKPFGSGVAAIAVHPSGQIILTQVAPQSSLWRRDLTRPDSAPLPVLPSKFHDWTPDLSPSADRIVFSSSRSGSYQLWTAPLDNPIPSRITAFPKGDALYPRWSPDGRSISFQANPAGNDDIYVIAAKPDALPIQITLSPADDEWPAWSPDGGFLYFSSIRNSAGHIFRVPAIGGKAVEFGKPGGALSVVSADGQSLYRISPQFGLERTAIDGTQEKRLTLENIVPAAPVLTKAGIVYVAAAPDGVSFPVKLFDPNIGESKIIGNLPKRPGPQISVTPDSSWIAWSEAGPGTAKLALVENFR